MKISVKLVLIVVCISLLAVALTGCPRAPEGDAGIGVSPPPRPPARDAEPAAAPDTLLKALEGMKTPNSYQMTITAPDGEQIVQLAQFADGKLARLKMEAEDGWMLMDMGENVMYMYDPDENMAMKMPLGGAEGADMDAMPTMSADDFDKNAAITSSENIGDVECWVVDTTPVGEDDKVKVWIAKSSGLVCQVQTGDETIMMAYERVNEISDDEFKLPDGVQILDMADMGLPTQ